MSLFDAKLKVKQGEGEDEVLIDGAYSALESIRIN